MTPEELDSLSTEEAFDKLRLLTDPPLAPLIDHLEMRWQLSSAAAKLWFAHTAGDILAERSRLDREALESEHNVG